VLSVIDWAVANNLSVTSILMPGTSLINPNSNFKNKEIADYFKNKNQNIATAYHDE
jgi:hypothetical protein